MKDKCEDYLKTNLKKRYVFFTPRGNISIRKALKLAKSLNKRKVLISDQGGWMVYHQAATKLRLKEITVKTDYGLMDVDGLKEHKNCVLIHNSMPAYSYLEDMGNINKVCKKNNIFLINDVSGSIGYEEAQVGDIIIGSFGENKPVNLGKGGFIATSKKEIALLLEKEISAADLDYTALFKKLRAVKTRHKFFRDVNKKIKRDMDGFKIVHQHKKNGLNVIIKHNDFVEKEAITMYCESNGYEFTECPRYIRIIEPAISIEVKRLEN